MKQIFLALAILFTSCNFGWGADKPAKSGQSYNKQAGAAPQSTSKQVNTKKTILITGTGTVTGFGHEVALRLAKNHNIIAGVLTDEEKQALQKEAAERKVSLEVIKLDITKDEDINQLDKYNIDILVNNAGTGQTGPVVDQPFEKFRESFEVNVFGTFKVTQKVLRIMISKGIKGKILFVSSNAGIEGIPNFSSYTGSKHAIEALAASLKEEVERFGIKVGNINPGPYQTGFNEALVNSAYEWYDKKTALTPEEDYHRIDPILATGQHDREEMIRVMVDIIPKDHHAYRTFYPKKVAERVRKKEAATWDWKM